jgi:hypothetical protein
VPKDQVQPPAVRVLRERFDIDIHDQVPRAVDQVISSAPRIDRLITLCDKSREHIQVPKIRRRAHWSLPDPAEARASYATFARIADDIDARVRHLIPVL